MDLAIIQSFLDRPVRFFKTNFEVDLRHHNDATGQKLEDHNDPPGQPENGTEMGGHDAPPISGRKFSFETWAIPLEDYAAAVGYQGTLIRRMIRLNIDSFRDFFQIEAVLDRTAAQRRKTILMAVEMCETLTMRLQASRIRDAEIRARVIRFQRWVPIVFHMIRTRKLRPVRWNKGIDLDSKYLPLLSIPSGRAHSERIGELAQAEGKSRQTIYRHLKAVRGTNIITGRGVPRKTRIRKAA